jgi:hypothetical protein
MGIFRCYGAEKFEDFCKEHMADGTNLDSIWKEFLALHCHNSVNGYVIEASCANDGKAHVIGFDTTYVFRSEFCMDIGDCECIVIEFDKR